MLVHLLELTHPILVAAEPRGVARGLVGLDRAVVVHEVEAADDRLHHATQLACLVFRVRVRVRVRARVRVRVRVRARARVRVRVGVGVRVHAAQLALHIDDGVDVVQQPG